MVVLILRTDEASSFRNEIKRFCDSTEDDVKRMKIERKRGEK
jgi:hypothetical protein